MNGSHAPGRSVFIISAGADLWVALDLASDISRCGGTALLDELVSSSARDSDRRNIESRLLGALDAADEILVLLTSTPGLLERRYLWLAIGWASARGIPIIGLLHGMTREELIAKSDFPTLITNNETFEYHDRESYLNRLKRLLDHPLEEPVHPRVLPGHFRLFVESLMPSKSEQTASPRIRSEGVYDVFLCYNSQDNEAVKEVGNQLRAQGLKPWLDEWELRPGRRWQPALERQIQSIRSAAVFIGESGIGPWQDMEQEAFLREFVKRLCPVIPVILSDCKETPQLPFYLSGLVWVDFRRREPNPLKQLIWGITGYREFVGSTLTTLREGESTEQGRILEISSQEGKARSDIDEVRLTHPEIQARADIDEIRRSLGDRSLREFNRLAEAILRRMGSREWEELESPPFEKGTVWEVTPPPLGLRLPRAARAVLFLRREEENDDRRTDLIELASQVDAVFLLIMDIVDIPSMKWQNNIRPYSIRFRPEDVVEMAHVRGDELAPWLGRFITKHVDSSVLVDLLPYKTEGPASLFIGRGGEIERMIGKMGTEPRGGIILGAHRSGKTSLLRKLGELLTDKKHLVVGPMTMSSETSFDDFLFDETMEVLGITPPSLRTPDSWASRLRDHRRHGSHVVFLLDEFDALLDDRGAEASGLDRQMRSLQYDDVAKFYLAGHGKLRRAIEREGGPFNNFAEEFVLKGLTESESLRLIQEPFKGLGLKVDDEKARRIYKGTAGVAVLIQGLCLQLLKEQLIRADRFEIDDSTFEKIERLPDYLSMVFSYYEYGLTWDLMSVVLIAALAGEVTRDLITAEFAQRGVSLDRTRLDDMLKFLVKFGVLNEYEIGCYGVLSDYFFHGIRGRDPRSLLEAKLKARE